MINAESSLPTQNIPILIRDLRKSYGDKEVLLGISAQIGTSGVTAILGRNGAGKTTLIKCCLGLERFNKGDVLIFGHKPGSASARQSLGIMLQETDLPGLLTGEELIRLFSSYYKSPLPYEEIMALTQTENFVRKRYKKLSGGQKRRIQFALAIVGDPQILFLDEPTTGLDINARKVLWETVRRFAEGGKSVILTTHYLEEADRLADRILVLDEGQIIEDAPAHDLKSRLGGDMIQCQTRLSLEDIQSLDNCLSVQTSGKITIIRSSDAAALLRQLLARDDTISDLTVSRPSLETILSEAPS